METEAELKNCVLFSSKLLLNNEDAQLDCRRTLEVK